MNGIVVSVLVGLCAGIGSLPLIFFNTVPKGIKDGLLGFAGGIMVFASSFNLLQPALKAGSILSVIGGIICGTLAITLIEYTVPHEHTSDYKKDMKSSSFKKTLLLGVAVAIHNIPEGFAIGVGYGSGNIATGLNLAFAIGVQNIPEGLVVAASLIEEGYKKSKTVLFSFLTGAGEPIAAIFGMATVNLVESYMPFILSFSAGAMFYVVSHELIPESHSGGNEMIATYGFILGLILMIVFRTVIGE